MKNDASKQQEINHRNNRYYDRVAENYDQLLTVHQHYDRIRKQIAEKVFQLLPSGKVLDFGGGTGEDLLWLLRGNYDLTFCEPSPEMRKKAIEKQQAQFPSATIRIIEAKATDFTTWGGDLPFPDKMDLVLANFAVINNINNLALLFENLAGIMAPGAPLLLNVLDYSFSKKWRLNPMGTLQSLLTQREIKILTEFEQEKQWIYLHPLASIVRAAQPNFSLVETQVLQKEEFTLVHLQRR